MSCVQQFRRAVRARRRGYRLDSPILEIAIALAFLFALFALLASTIAEIIASWLGLRAQFLLKGLRALLDGSTSGSTNATDWLLQQSLVRNQGSPTPLPSSAAGVSRRQLRKMPSYLASRTFARSVVATLVPNSSGATTLTEISTALTTLPEGAMRQSLEALLANADGEVEKFRLQVEQWYDDHMNRVSGWYRRRLRCIVFAIGVVLVVMFNANAVTITSALYSDEVLRESVVTLAVTESNCSDKEPSDCLEQIRTDLAELGNTGLPLFWGTDPACETAAITCSLPERLRLTDPTSRDWQDDARRLGLVLVGWIVFAIALIPGANFWFDSLSRLGGLRSSGPKPATTDG